MPSTPTTMFDSYQARLATGDLQPDAAQAEAVKILQIFADGLKGYEVAAKGGGFSSLVGQIFSGKNSGTHSAVAGHKGGLYIYGKVGRGKSMLMDLFMEHVEVVKKRRVHFHQFMLEIHARLNKLRQNGPPSPLRGFGAASGARDIMESLVQGIADETSLLCFDEFHVSNIADAMILGRLFSELFAVGVIVVSTSNWAPDELYKNGLQRDRFLPFITLIKAEMQVFEMDGKIDYRYEQLRNLESYFYPLGLETTRKLQGIFIDLTHDAKPELIELIVNGRDLKISNAAQGIGFFNFDELCQTALGAADYLAIAECLHTVILDGVPQLARSEQRNEAVRFMTLIDSLYEAKVKLFMACATPIEELAPFGDVAVPFQRTVSRLMEMQGEAYRLKQHHGEGT
jgi:cell division protein ZapE